jgi:hypothetical protein
MVQITDAPGADTAIVACKSTAGFGRPIGTDLLRLAGDILELRREDGDGRGLRFRRDPGGGTRRGRRSSLAGRDNFLPAR